MAPSNISVCRGEVCDRTSEEYVSVTLGTPPVIDVAKIYLFEKGGVDPLWSALCGNFVVSLWREFGRTLSRTIQGGVSLP